MLFLVEEYFPVSINARTTPFLLLYVTGCSDLMLQFEFLVSLSD